MMNTNDDSEYSNQNTQDLLAATHNISEDLTAIHVAAQLMCRQSEGRQTYPVAKSIVMIAEQVIEKIKNLETSYNDKNADEVISHE